MTKGLPIDYLAWRKKDFDSLQRRTICRLAGLIAWFRDKGLEAFWQKGSKAGIDARDWPTASAARWWPCTLRRAPRTCTCHGLIFTS